MGCKDRKNVGRKCCGDGGEQWTRAMQTVQGGGTVHLKRGVLSGAGNRQVHFAMKISDEELLTGLF